MTKLNWLQQAEICPPAASTSRVVREQSNEGPATAGPFAHMGTFLREQALDVGTHIRKNAALSCGAYRLIA